MPALTGGSVGLMSEGLDQHAFSKPDGIARRARQGCHSPLCPVFIPCLLWDGNLAGPFAHVEKTQPRKLAAEAGAREAQRPEAL